MKLPYLVALVLTGVVGSTYWYQSSRHICPIPVGYRLGTIDSSFSITETEALTAIDAAATLWEDAVGVDLFVYDQTADLEVSFVFDERQATANAQADDEARLDSVQSENEQIKTAIQTMQTSYETLQATFTDRKATYDANLAAYNDVVRQANDRGGATAQEFASLEQTQAELQTELQEIRAMASELNGVAAQLNELSARGNRLVQSYNREIRNYNNQYTEGEEFTQGDYTGEAIHIYKFSNENELTAVLAHEFGHALNIKHVEQPGALMYYLLEEGDSTTPALASADLDAYNSACQIDSWEFTLRSVIRSILS